MADSKFHATGVVVNSAAKADSPLAKIAGPRQVFIRDLILPCNIGVHRHEKGAPQRIRINLDLTVRDGDGPINDSLDKVVCYEDIAKGTRAIVNDGHINLVETLAERLASFCLKDIRVETVRVRVEKLDVFPDVASVGTEIVRTRTS